MSVHQSLGFLKMEIRYFLFASRGNHQLRFEGAAGVRLRPRGAAKRRGLVGAAAARRLLPAGAEARRTFCGALSKVPERILDFRGLWRAAFGASGENPPPITPRGVLGGLRVPILGRWQYHCTGGTPPPNLRAVFWWF